MAESNNIEVMIKPDSVSYESVHEVLYRAHQPLRDTGIVMTVPLKSAEELEEWVGKDGKCFVALDGEKVVGTAAYRFRNHNSWYWKGRLIELTMDAVLPEYQGKHIFSRLIEIRDQEILKENCAGVFFETAENNTRRQEIAIKEGFTMVDYYWHSDHYSVGMMKWLSKRPYSNIYCSIGFAIKKLYVKMRRVISK